MNLRRDHQHNPLSTTLWNPLKTYIERRSKDLLGHWKPLTIILNTFHTNKIKKTLRKEKNLKTTLNGGSLGSRIDEERSELRYVVWIADICESSNLRTHIALGGHSPKHVCLSIRKPYSFNFFLKEICGLSLDKKREFCEIRNSLQLYLKQR